MKSRYIGRKGKIKKKYIPYSDIFRGYGTARAVKPGEPWKREIVGEKLARRKRRCSAIGRHGCDERSRRCRWDRSLCVRFSLLPLLSVSLPPFPRERDRRASYWLIVRARDRNRRGLVIAAVRVFHSKISFSARIRYRHRVSDGRGGWVGGGGVVYAAQLCWGSQKAPRELFCIRGSRSSGLFYEAIFI